MIKTIRGMHDVLPNNSNGWNNVVDILQQFASSYGFDYIQTPILENTELFKRSVGESSDIVSKEMYQFQDKSDSDVCLRPEGTAGVVRSVLQNNMLREGIQRLHYFGPMFRYERPQKGRYRQFHQFGAEILGFNGFDGEIELISLSHDLLSKFNILKSSTLHINSLGSIKDREKYLSVLRGYLNDNIDFLDENSKSIISTNPLRIFDSKISATQDILKKAPKIVEFLSQEGKEYFKNIQNSLDNLGIKYVVDDSLVRGLDYYSDIVFEYKTDLLGSQSTICAGGRYDNLISQLGGKENSAVGFAIGMERIMLVLEELNSPIINQRDVVFDIYIVCKSRSAIDLGHKLQKNIINTLDNIRVCVDYSDSSIKTQLKKANKYGSKISIIIAEDEVEANMVQIRDMSAKTQKESHSNEVIGEILNILIKS